MTLITVYTPTYNRAYTLPQAYEALLRQTSKNFEWLIVDDGSTDNTKELVESWIKEGKITIRYIFQNNQGVHVARNTAIENITTELNVCVDSDDYLTDDAIESIVSVWSNEGGEQFAGLIGWDIYKDGSVVGDKFPPKVKFSTLIDLYELYKIPGDKKPVYRTDLAKKYPSPVFYGEKYFPNRYKYAMTDKHGPCILLHKPLCVVEYLPDGLTAQRYKRYIKNPKGFVFYRKFLLDTSKSTYIKVKQAIHYNSMCILSKEKGFIRKSGHPYLVSFTFPFGLILLNFLKYKAKK